MTMTVEKAHEICNAKDLSKYTREECRASDEWIKQYALNALKTKLRGDGFSREVRAFILLMVRCHYGSVETDDFLRSQNCYPEWLTRD